MAGKPTEDTVRINIIDLDTEGRLYAVLGALKENIWTRWCTGETIIQDVFKNLSEYCRGWYDMPVLDVSHFAELLAVHKANEYDGGDTEEGLIVRRQRYEVFLKRVLSALRESAKGEASFFTSGRALLGEMTDNELSWGSKKEFVGQAGFRIRNLSEVLLKPGEALEWFIATSTYADLLPELFRKFMARQQNTATQEGNEKSILSAEDAKQESPEDG